MTSSSSASLATTHTLDGASNEAGMAEIFMLILVLLAIVALTIWIVQQVS